MELTKEEYQTLVTAKAGKSPILKDTLLAFLFGGSICAVGQLIENSYRAAGLSEKAAGGALAVTLIALSALLTALHLYHRLARYGGAGTLVPITGFANAMAAPAIEFRSEGFITGTAAKMFTVAGPVLVYGISASIVYGFLYWLFTAL